MKAIHLKVTGRVQGVFFRSSTKEKADALGLTGWVRNCDDGSVEVFAQGDDEKLKEFEEWCHHGSDAASVSDVSRSAAQSDVFTNFSIQL